MVERFPVPRPVTPGYLDGIFGRMEHRQGDNPISSLAMATRAAREAWKASFEYFENREADDTLNEAQRVLRVGQYVKKQIEKANDLHSKALDIAGPELSRLDNELSARFQPPTTAGQAAIHQEIRSRFAAMESGEQRAHALEAALDAGDVTVVRAVLEAPAMLSGIVQPTHDRLKARYLQKLAPDQYKRREELREGLRTATKALTMFNDHAARIVDWSAVASLEERAREPEPVSE